MAIMLVTEKEAQGRWCAFGHQAGFFGSTPLVFNRQPNGDVPSCLGSLCMSWRWEKPKGIREIDLVTTELVDDQPRRGYCGLAGKPDVEE